MFSRWSSQPARGRLAVASSFLASSRLLGLRFFSIDKGIKGLISTAALLVFYFYFNIDEAYLFEYLSVLVYGDCATYTITP